MVGNNTNISRRTSAFGMKNRASGLRSGTGNRIVTGADELRIKQENIDKVMMNKIHQDKPGGRSR